MRIIHIDFDDLNNPAGGGQARRTYEINRRLAERHQITVYTSRFPGSRDEVIDGVEYRRVGLSSFPGNMLAFFGMMPLLARHARRADLLVEDFTSPFSCGMTPLFTRTPVVASAQYFFARFMAEKYRLPLDLLERHGLAVYRDVIAPTRRIAGQILRFHPQARVGIIPYGIERQFYDVPRQDGSFVAFVGRIDIHQKGLDVLMNALARLPAPRRPAVHIFGGGRDLPRLQSLVHDLGLEGSVTYRGRVAGAERQASMANARFVCVPSRYETFGIVVAEAMAAARPVVGSAGIGFEEIFGGEPCGTLVPPDDPDALADALEHLWNAPEECARMGTAARQRARRFDWDQIALEQEELYLRAS